ncbi:MAG: hypothetical protein ACTSP3_04860 [Candidatus Heimdallarchaeaceae archaeon]
MTIEAKKVNAPLGIESSGHIIIPEFFLFDDALVTPLKIAEILNLRNEKLSELVAKIPTYPSKKIEISCSDELKFQVIDRLKEELKAVRVELDNGWVLIRPSNTSPIIRMTIEANDESEIKEISRVFREKVERIINKNQS